MIDPIERQDVIDLIERMEDGYSFTNLQPLTEGVMDIPTAQKRGEWIVYNPEDIGCTNCRCSECRTEFFFPEIEVRPYAYCPACESKLE